MIQEILLYISVIFAGSIVVTHLVCLVGVLMNRVRDVGRAGRRISIKTPPLSVSVIVVAKDEEKNLPPLLASLESQSAQNFQIILASDRSKDGTLALMRAFAKKHGSRVKVLENTEEVDHLGPKQFVLDIATGVAQGQLLIFTDADCTVPARWVENLKPYFLDPRVGVVFGQISLRRETGFFKNFQAFDQPLIHQYNSATAGLGMPGSCFGNNLAVRRDVLEQIGGFRNLGYTLTEDAALTTAAAKQGWKVRVSTRTDTMIQTVAQEHWRNFINQHLRWNGGAFYHEDFATRFAYRYITLYLICSVLAVPAAVFLPFLFVLPAASFISVGLMAFLAGILYRRDKSWYLLRLVPYTCFFLVFYSFVTVLSIFRVPPRWKGKRWQAAHRDASV
ncbi:MAG: glycosyltransferase [Spirochaetaceae bacterium]|nr:MAG: glycosyltransferase [Spirochaetaceae bacterium]